MVETTLQTPRSRLTAGKEERSITVGVQFLLRKCVLGFFYLEGFSVLCKDC